jgi:hypothetical protein
MIYRVGWTGSGKPQTFFVVIFLYGSLLECQEPRKVEHDYPKEA